MIVGTPTKLNLIPSGVMPVVYINQGDAGYDKEFLIYNGDTPYNVPSGVSATIRGTKADGFGVTEAAAVTAGSNLVTVTITEQMVAAAGENLYELVFVDTDDLRVASINMIWAVKRDALGDSVISDSDLDYATQVMNQLQSASALKAQVDTNTANIAAETSARITADSDERTARIAADNTLQTELNAEAGTRATKDASLQSQINQLVAPSGSAPSAAEVQNARISADGTTYSTLGDAIRNQVTDVNALLKQHELALDAVDTVVSNLFDGNYAIGYAIFSDYTFNAVANNTMVIVPVDGGSTYFIRISGDHDRFRVAWGTSKLPVGQTVTNITPSNANISGCYEVTVPATAKYLYIFLSTQGQTPSVYVGKYEVFSIVPYDSPVNGNVMRETAANLSAHIMNALSTKNIVNLFDGNYINDIGLLALGVVPGNGLFTVATDSRTIIVPVKPSTQYYFRSFDAHNRFRCAFTKNYPVVDDTVYLSESFSTVGNLYEPIHSDSDSNWLTISVTSQGDEPRVQITEGVDSTTFIGYNSLSPREGATAGESSYFFLDDINGIFDAETAPAALNENTTRIGDIYAIYDALVSANPNYISVETLGTVSSENLQMRKYTFNSLQIQNNSLYTLAKPKLIFIAGIHGYEQGSSYCLARVMKQITEGTDEISRFIKNNVEIIVVPVANPYGYNHNQRKNENGVDLNRNFSAGWSASGSPSDEYYGGASPNSEVETQLLTTLLNDNSDAYYSVDFHNIATGYPLLYLYNNAQVQFCNSLFASLTKKWLSEYSGFPTNRLLGYCNTGVSACFAMQSRSIGVESFTAEAPWVMPVIGSTKYDIPTLTIGCDVFGNVLVMLAKSMK